MNKFANININKVFDVLGIQIDKRRSMTEIFEYSKNIDSNSFYSSGKKREYTGRFYSSTFKQSAVKLYLTLYFYANSHGVTEEIGYQEIADMMHINIKTVKASLSALSDKGYISVYQPTSKTFFAEILEYESMYKKGQHPSIGYITLNSDILFKIIELKGINSIRCAVTVIFRTLRNQFRSSSKTAAAEISIKNITWNLPKYIKPWIIKDALKQTKDLFDIRTGRFGRYIFILSEEYRASSIKAQIREDAKLKLNDIISKIDLIRKNTVDDIQRYGVLSTNTISEIIGTGISEEELISSYDKDIPALNFNSSQRNDIAQICTEYNPSVVMMAVWNYFKNYCLKRIHIDNPGGLIRKIVKEYLLFGPKMI